jgi:hypothetical protein
MILLKIAESVIMKEFEMPLYPLRNYFHIRVIGETVGPLSPIAVSA